MVRTRGARDLKPRKKRKKKKVLKKFPKKPKGRKTELKLYFWRQLQMSKEGYRNWSKKLRPHTRKIVYKPFLRVDVPVERISSIEAIKDLALEIIGQEGTFIMRGISHAKTKTHYKWVRLAVIKIIKSKDNEMRVISVSEIFRLSRYWFWSGE